VASGTTTTSKGPPSRTAVRGTKVRPVRASLRRASVRAQHHPHRSRTRCGRQAPGGGPLPRRCRYLPPAPAAPRGAAADSCRPPGGGVEAWAAGPSRAGIYNSRRPSFSRPRIPGLTSVSGSGRGQGCGAGAAWWRWRSRCPGWRTRPGPRCLPQLLGWHRGGDPGGRATTPPTTDRSWARSSPTRPSPGPTPTTPTPAGRWMKG
jgi:hypothetical protein